MKENILPYPRIHHYQRITRPRFRIVFYQSIKLS